MGDPRPRPGPARRGLPCAPAAHRTPQFAHRSHVIIRTHKRSSWEDLGFENSFVRIRSTLVGAAAIGRLTPLVALPGRLSQPKHVNRPNGNVLGTFAA
jgi:hypothetical protein